MLLLVMDKTDEQMMAEHIAEKLMIIESDMVLHTLLEDLRVAKGRDSIVVKETNYIIKE